MLTRIEQSLVDAVLDTDEVMMTAEGTIWRARAEQLAGIVVRLAQPRLDVELGRFVAALYAEEERDAD